MNERDVFRDALRFVTDTSVEKIARTAGYSRQMFESYLNRRPASRSAARALVRVLRDRAGQLERYAEQLEKSVDEGPGDGPE